MIKFLNATVFLIIFGAVLFASIPAQAQLDFKFFGPIVPECTGGINACTICDLFKLAQNILNFLWSISVFVAILMLAYGGFLFLLPYVGGSQGMADRGKKAITNALVGILIAFFAWLGIDTIIKIIGDRGGFLPKELVADAEGEVTETELQYGPWYEINCTAPPITLQAPIFTPGPPAGPPGAPPGAPPESCIGEPGSEQCSSDLAKTIDDNDNIIISNDADCNNTSGTPVSAQTTISELSNQQAITKCSHGCTGNNVCAADPDLQVDATLLFVASEVGNTSPYTITSITTGDHSETSCHYEGKCIDVQTSGSYADLEHAFESYEGMSAACENAGGDFIPCTSGSINHMHVESILTVYSSSTPSLDDIDFPGGPPQ